MGVNLAGQPILLLFAPYWWARIAEIGETYDLLARGDVGLLGIHCNICDQVSFNPNDAANLYCGHCHFFHPPSGRLDGA